MNINIKLKSSYRTKDFLFAVGQSPTTSSLIWGGSNNIKIQNEGQYYCFAKSKRTGKISIVATVVNCNQTDVNCDIITLPPYILGNCEISTLPPYVLQNELISSWMLDDGIFNTYSYTGSLVETPMTITLSGEDKNLLTVISTLTDLEVKEAETIIGYYRVAYSIDFGDKDGDMVGWTYGLPTNLELVADGRVHSLIIGLVGDVWGTDTRLNKMKTLYQTFFKVGGIPDGLVNYPISFNPSSQLSNEMFEILPSFSLPDKCNIYGAEMKESLLTSDYRQRGWKYWGMYRDAITSFPSSLRFKTDYDSWARNAGFTSANDFNSISQSRAEELGRDFANTGLNFGVLMQDNEWFNGGSLNETGKQNMKYFFYEAHRVNPNCLYFCHHFAPYSVKSGYFEGSISALQVAEVLDPAYTKDQLITNYVNSNQFGVYWQDINGQRGECAGDYINMSVSAYLSYYNPMERLYFIFHNLIVNKKFYPNKRVCAVIAGMIEVSVSSQDGVTVSWKWDTGGERENLNPQLPPCYTESVAIGGNWLADGIICWDEGLVTNEENRDSFTAFHSEVGWTPNNGDAVEVDTYNKGKYPKQYQGVYSYAGAGLEKYSRMDYASSTLGFCEISTDNGATWITGLNATPIPLHSEKKPMAFYRQVGSVLSVFAIHPMNNPTQKYNFKIRVNGIVRDVFVNGQYPEIINFAI